MFYFKGIDMKRILYSTVITLIITSHTLFSNDNNSSIYLGLGYTKTNINLDIDISSTLFTYKSFFDTSANNILFLAGYNFNNYFSTEGRYYVNLSSVAIEHKYEETPLIKEYKTESFALYLKPKYHFKTFTFYALLGGTFNQYKANTLVDKTTETLFSWGAGMKFNITKSFELFIDYTDFGENNNPMIKTELSSFNGGFSYTF